MLDECAERAYRNAGPSNTIFLKLFKDVEEGGCRLKAKVAEIRDCFFRILVYCCDIPAARGMSAAQQKARRQQLSIRRHSRSEERVRGRRRSSRVVVETTDTRRKIVEMRAEAASLEGI